MAKRQIVIEIDDKIYDFIKRVKPIIEYIDKKEDTVNTALKRAVLNGTPLPKGHGRLKDADAVFNDNFPKANIEGDALENMKAYPYWKTDITGLQNILNNAPTIIEAEGSDGEK